MFVPEAFVKTRAAKVELGERSSVDEATPTPEIENFVELLIWKFMKSPLKVDVGLIPIKVPETFPLWMMFDPRSMRDEVAAWKGNPPTWNVEVVPPVAFTSPPALQMWRPVHVGAIDCERAGAASLRIKVFAEPFTAESPTEAEGFAPVEVVTVSPFSVRRVDATIFVTVKFVPVADVKMRPVVVVFVSVRPVPVPVVKFKVGNVP